MSITVNVVNGRSMDDFGMAFLVVEEHICKKRETPSGLAMHFWLTRTRDKRETVGGIGRG